MFSLTLSESGVSCCHVPFPPFTPPNRTTKKGYEEVHVPALKPKPYEDGELLGKEGLLLLLLRQWAACCLLGVCVLGVAGRLLLRSG